MDNLNIQQYNIPPQQGNIQQPPIPQQYIPQQPNNTQQQETIQLNNTIRVPQSNNIQNNVQGPIDLEDNEDELEEYKQLLDDLYMYSECRFTTRIVDKYPGIFDTLPECSIEKLRERILICQKCIKSRNAQKVFEQLFDASLRLCDVGYSIIGYNVKGARELVIKDESLLDSLEEVRLKYKSNKTIEPKYRLMFGVLTTYMHVAQMNQQLDNDSIKQKTQGNINNIIDTIKNPINNNIKEKYLDI